MMQSLISFNVLDHKGYSFKDKDGAMHVYKGFKVALRDTKTWNIKLSIRFHNNMLYFCCIIYRSQKYD